jgi:hypothetical protein
MPQPLSEVSPDGRLTFAAGVLRTSPFATDVAYVIALWAHTDGDIASILSRMLKADIAVGTAMYLSLVSSGGQKSALKAAAREALPAWQEILLRAITSVVEPWRETRNHFAHRVWGHCSELPDAILLTHPKTIVHHNISRRQRVLELPDGRGVIRPMPIDDTQILVYRKVDFEEAIAEAERARDLYRLFYAILSGPSIAGPREQLLQDPVVRAKARQMAESASEEVWSELGFGPDERRRDRVV